MKKILLVQKVTAICGSENHHLTFMEGLDKTKFDVHFLMLYEPGNELPEFEKKVKELGVTFHRVKIRSSLDPIFFLQTFYFLLLNRFDLIHTHLIHADLFVTLIAKLAFQKHIFTTKHADNNFRKNSILGKIDGLISNIFHKKVIVISHFLKEFYETHEKIPSSKLEVIHYGFAPKDLSTGTDIRKEFNLKEDTPLLIKVARLMGYKGHKILFDAIMRVKEEIPNIKLLCIGDGPLREELEAKIKKNKLEKNVTITGYRHDVHDFYKACDIVVHVPSTEGFGLITLEAMLHSRPLVVTNGGALPEIVVNNKTGLIVPPLKVQPLSEALITLVKNKELQNEYGLNGKNHLLESFTVPVMVNKIVSVYDNFLNK